MRANINPQTMHSHIVLPPLPQEMFLIAAQPPQKKRAYFLTDFFSRLLNPSGLRTKGVGGWHGIIQAPGHESHDSCHPVRGTGHRHPWVTGIIYPSIHQFKFWSKLISELASYKITERR